MAETTPHLVEDHEQDRAFDARDMTPEKLWILARTGAQMKLLKDKDRWFLETGLDEATILVFGNGFDDPAKKTMKIQGPTIGLLNAYTAGGNDDGDAAVEIVRHCVLAMPSGMVARRNFAHASTVFVKAGDPLPIPYDIVFKRPEGVDEKVAEAALTEYVLRFLPNGVVKLALAGAVILATPEITATFGKASEEGKRSTDPLSQGSSGSSEVMS